ncbi:MAG TPA: hypothetical protein VIX90_02855 [Edaphobacter sp.]
MLVFAETTPSDLVYDPGSGDGRIPILAAQEFEGPSNSQSRRLGGCPTSRF